MHRYSRTIMILVDGARPDVLNEELSAGNLPNIARHFAESGTNATILTCFPSTTGAAYLPYLTGCHPGTCNVPGIRWFDKPEYARRGWGFKSFRSYVGLESYLFDRDIAPEVKTAWDIFNRPCNVLNVVTRGLSRRRDITHFSRVWHFLYAHRTDRWDRLDNTAFRHTQRVIRAKDFDFLFLVFPSVDEYSHRSSPFSPRVRQAYSEVDTLIGKIFAELKSAGMAEDTLVTVVSDHGLTETQSHFDIGPWLKSEKKMRTFYYTNILKFRFDAATMVSGNAMCHLYFRGIRGWNGRKSFEEISHDGILLDELRFRPEIELVCAQGADGAIHVLTAKGHGWFSIDAVTEKFRYRFDRDDPLGIFTRGDPRLESGFTPEESLALTWDSHSPDIFVQLTRLFASPRTGDVVVTAKPGYDLRKKFEHPIHKASHGSLCPEHMRVPWLINHKLDIGRARSVDVFATVLKLAGKEIPHGVEGRVLV